MMMTTNDSIAATAVAGGLEDAQARRLLVQYELFVRILLAATGRPRPETVAEAMVLPLSDLLRDLVESCQRDVQAADESLRLVADSLGMPVDAPRNHASVAEYVGRVLGGSPLPSLVSGHRVEANAATVLSGGPPSVSLYKLGVLESRSWFSRDETMKLVSALLAAYRATGDH